MNYKNSKISYLITYILIAMLFAFLIINILSYSIMWIDKLKSIYKWWRISEKTLWWLSLLGGVFGVWLGMQAPLYHKAGKMNFRIWIPIIACMWIAILIYFKK